MTGLDSRDGIFHLIEGRPIQLAKEGELRQVPDGVVMGGGGVVETVEAVEAFETLTSNPAMLGQLGRLQSPDRGGSARGELRGPAARKCFHSDRW